MGWSTWDYNQYLIRRGFSHVQPGGPAVNSFFKSLHSDKWPKFPEPIPFSSDVRVLACEKDLLVQIENISGMIGRWLYSTFVPQPSEIVRKFLTGKTKKGYFGLPLEFAPLDILWSSGDGTKILATIAGPLAEGLYFLWLQQSAITALQTAQQIGMLFTACPDNQDETLLADGLAVSFIGSGSGSLPLWVTVQDPHNRYNSPGATITTKGHWVNSSMWGHVSAQSENISSMKVQLLINSRVIAEEDLGSFVPGQQKNFTVTGAGACTPTDLLTNKFIKVVSSSGASGATYVGYRWVMNSNPFLPWNEGPIGPRDPCQAYNKPLLYPQGAAISPPG